MKRLSKQRLRSRLSRGASFTEIYLTGLILVGVAIYTVDIMRELYEIVISFPHYVFTIEEFLSHVLALIVAIEFVKMLAKHTPGSAIDVLLFAIARKLIVSHDGSMLDSLIGVIAIAILFAVRKYLSTGVHHNGDATSMVNGGMSTKEFNEIFKTDLSPEMGYTVAGVVYNHSKERKEDIVAGYEMDIGHKKLEVYTMDDQLIKQVKVHDKIG